MFDSIAEKILANIISGGQGAIISILIGITLVLGWWITRLDGVIRKKDARLDEVIDSNQKTSMALSESMNAMTRSIIELMKTRI